MILESFSIELKEILLIEKFNNLMDYIEQFNTAICLVQ